MKDGFVRVHRYMHHIHAYSFICDYLSMVAVYWQGQ